MIRFAKFAVLFVGLFCISHAAAAQNAVVDKHSAVVEMLRVTDVKSKVVALYKHQVVLYNATFPDAVITDFEGKGLFKRLTPDQESKMKALIREFGARVSVALQKGVVDEVVTDSAVETIYAPIYEQTFTLEELQALAAFYSTADGKRVFDRYTDALAESIIAAMQSRGLYQVLPSPEAEMAKLDRFQNEMKANPTGFTKEIFAQTESRFSAQLTEPEKQSLITFWQTSAGRKMSGIGVDLAASSIMRTQQLYGSRIGDLTRKVLNEQLVWFNQRTIEICGKPAGKGSGHE